MQSAIVKIIGGCLSHPGHDAETTRKIPVLFILLVLASPAVLGFGLDDLFSGNIQEGWLSIGVALLLLSSLVLLKFLGRLEMVFRLLAGLLLIFLAYELSIGGGDGYAFVWFYCYPITIFYLLEKNEGRLWTGLSLVIAAVIFLSPLGRETYGFSVGMRFLITYALVFLLSYGLESSRAYYFKREQAEKVALAAALRQVKTLRGLLPICACCKKIRDDKGYWNQIETYLHLNSEAQLSHGICPECLQQHYPEEYYTDNPAL